MVNGRYPVLAREGWGHIGFVVAVAAAIHYLIAWYWAIPLWIAALFVIQFFRDPHRTIPADRLGVVCPADGKIVAVGELDDPYLKRRALRISIFMNVFNVHSNRIPVEGKLVERWYHRGRFFNAELDKASLENERNALWIQTNEEDDIVVVQVAGLIARRILCYVQPGERVGQGQRYGFIRFGSRVDVYLPVGSRSRVALGDRVKGGCQLIASLVHGSKGVNGE
jgi:phosphatidylserine decarboxylase